MFVGAMLVTFGTFWAGEGLSVEARGLRKRFAASAPLEVRIR
jgi:hypothetical protein